MKPLVWGAVAGGTIISVLLFSRKTAPPATPVSPPPQTYGETTRVALSIPAGWRRLASGEVTPELRTQANTLRSAPGFSSMQYGTLAPFTASDGKTYATWIEQHYHAPGSAALPWGLHHGVTLLAQT